MYDSNIDVQHMLAVMITVMLTNQALLLGCSLYSTHMMMACMSPLVTTLQAGLNNKQREAEAQSPVI